MSSRQAIICITWEEITYATEENSPRHFAMHLPFAKAEPIFKTPTIASVFHGEELSKSLDEAWHNTTKEAGWTNHGKVWKLNNSDFGRLRNAEDDPEREREREAEEKKSNTEQQQKKEKERF